MEFFNNFISSSHSKSKELEATLRSAILQQISTGTSIRKVAAQFKVSKGAVERTISHFKTHKTLHSIKRSGRPTIISEKTERIIIGTARKSPKTSYAELREELASEFSVSTVRRVIYANDLRKWKARSRIPLTPVLAKNRRDFATKWLESGDIIDAIFSDETSIQNTTSFPTEWVFFNSTNRYYADKVSLGASRCSMSIMAWGAIWIGGRSDLIVMNPDAPLRITTEHYLTTLEFGLLPHYIPGRVFQQDNAPIHSSKRAQEWFEEHRVKVMDWPAYSPDLNPIEHVWSLLKRSLASSYPELMTLIKNAMNRQHLTQCIQEAWWNIDQAIIDKLIRSVPDRLQFVKRAKGWYTKY